MSSILLRKDHEPVHCWRDSQNRQMYLNASQQECFFFCSIFTGTSRWNWNILTWRGTYVETRCLLMRWNTISMSTYSLQWRWNGKLTLTPSTGAIYSAILYVSSGVPNLWYMKADDGGAVKGLMYDVYMLYNAWTVYESLSHCIHL